MDAIDRLEARIRSLETSRNRTRLAAWVFGLMSVLVSATAMAPQTTPLPQTAQTVDSLTTERITLTGAADGSALVLVAGPRSSLVVQTDDGRETARLGGQPAQFSK